MPRFKLGLPRAFKRRKTGSCGACTEYLFVSGPSLHSMELIRQWIKVALAFINESCASTHGAIRTKAVFLSLSGEWKLGGFEVLSNPKDDASVLYVRVGQSFHCNIPNISLMADFGKSST